MSCKNRDRYLAMLVSGETESTVITKLRQDKKRGLIESHFSQLTGCSDFEEAKKMYPEYTQEDLDTFIGRSILFGV